MELVYLDSETGYLGIQVNGTDSIYENLIQVDKFLGEVNKNGDYHSSMLG